MSLCALMFIDLGAGVGGNAKLLYGSARPSGSLGAAMESVFGKSRSKACYRGFEANPAHYDHLSQLQASYKKNNVEVVKQPVDTVNRTTPFAHFKLQPGNGTKASLWQPKGQTTSLTSINFPQWFERHTVGVGKILLAMDIESSEYEILLAMLARGQLCAVHTLHVKWNPTFCKTDLCRGLEALPNLLRLLDKVGCKTRLVYADGLQPHPEKA